MEEYQYSSLRRELGLKLTDQQKEEEAHLRAMKQGQFDFSALGKAKRPGIFGEDAQRELVRTQELSGFTHLEALRDMEVISFSREAEEAMAGREGMALSGQARLMRDQVLKHLKLDAITKKHIETQEKSLHYVVNTFVSEKDKKVSARLAVQILKDFRKMKEQLARDPLLSGQEKARRLYNSFKALTFNIEVYKETYAIKVKEKRRREGIELYLSRFERLIEYFEKKDSGQETDEDAFGELLKEMQLDQSPLQKKVFGKEKDFSSLLTKRINFLEGTKEEPGDRLQREQEKRALDKNLTPEQLRGVNAADAMLMSLGINDEKRLPFVNKILELSAREKLYFYQVIERKGRLAAPGMTDAAISQLGYIPDSKQILDRLYRINFRLWEVITPDHFHFCRWDMLEAAFAQVRTPAVKTSIREYAALASNAQDDAYAEVLTDANAFARKEEGTVQFADEDRLLQEFNQKTRNVFTMEEQRDRSMQKALLALTACHEAVQERDNAWFTTKWYRKKTAEQKAEEAAAAMEILKKQDLALSRTIDETRQFYASNAPASAEALKAEGKPNGFSETGKAASDLLFAGSQATALFSKVNLIPKLFATDIYKMGIRGQLTGTDPTVQGLFQEHSLNGLLAGANYTTGALLTIGGCINAIGAVKGAIGAVKMIRSGNFGETDMWLTAGKTVRGLAGVGVGIGSGVTNLVFASHIADAMMGSQAWSGAIAGMKTGLQAAGTIMAGTGIVLDLADIAVQLKHDHHQDKALEEFSKVKERLGDSEKDKRKAMYLDNMAKLDNRNKGRQRVGTLFSLASNSVSLGAALTSSAGVGLTLAVASLGLTLTAKLTDYCMKSHSQRKSVEEFLNLEDLSWLTEEGETLFPGTVPPMEEELQTLELKKSIMNHLAAELGFATFKGMYKHIVGKYAGFIYQNLFFDAQGKPFFHWSSEPASKDPMVVGCFQFVKGLGLAVRYPTSSDKANEERRPTIQAIAARLGG